MKNPSKSDQAVTLQEPLVRGDNKVAELNIRTPKAGELRGLSLADLLQLDVNALKTLLPRISSPSITEQEVNNLHPADLVQLGGKVISFLVPTEQQPSPSA